MIDNNQKKGHTVGEKKLDENFRSGVDASGIAYTSFLREKLVQRDFELCMKLISSIEQRLGVTPTVADVSPEDGFEVIWEWDANRLIAVQDSQTIHWSLRNREDDTHISGVASNVEDVPVDFC